MSLLALVAATLRQHRTSFAVIGAAAMAVHGFARSTEDLDLLAIDPACLDHAWWSTVSEHGVSVDVRRGDDDDPLAGVVRFMLAPEQPLDLVVGKGGWAAGVLQRAVETPLADTTVAVATRADLILLKLYAGGLQDAWDIRQLLALPGDVLPDVETRLGALPARCRRLWDRILRETTGDEPEC